MLKNNTKGFVVTAEFKINRVVWRTLGYGDQPSKAEVVSVVNSYLDSVAVLGVSTATVARYMGAPGHYKIFSTLTVSQPWWRRAGFGDTVSVDEVKVQFEDFLHRLAIEYLVSVTKAV